MADNEQDQVDTEFDDELDNLENEGLETAEPNDEEDVKAALEKEDTEDGKGGAVVPAADFQSFAGDDVENDVDEDEKKSLEG